MGTKVNDPLREQLIALLTGGNAHMSFEDAIKDFPMSYINDKFPNGTYSFWGLLEHIRITQHDILDFMVNKNYKEPEWPKDYWPDAGKKATEKDWKKTIELFEKDMNDLIAIVRNPNTDLNAKVLWGDGQTNLREILVVADHNAYHIGEFTIMRQVMKTWGKGHV
jgi:hypothetical protein